MTGKISHLDFRYFCHYTAFPELHLLISLKMGRFGDATMNFAICNSVRYVMQFNDRGTQNILMHDGKLMTQIN